MNRSVLDQLTWLDIREINIAVADAIQEFPEGTDEMEIFTEAIRLIRQRHDFLDPVRERYPIVARAAEKATGTKVAPGRSRPRVLVRAFIAYRLCAEGYSRNDVGKVLGLDHSTVLHLCRKVEGMLSLPRAYAQEVKMFADFEGLLDRPSGCI